MHKTTHRWSRLAAGTLTALLSLGSHAATQHEKAHGDPRPTHGAKEHSKQGKGHSKQGKGHSKQGHGRHEHEHGRFDFQAAHDRHAKIAKSNLEVARRMHEMGRRAAHDEHARMAHRHLEVAKLMHEMAVDTRQDVHGAHGARAGDPHSRKPDKADPHALPRHQAKHDRHVEIAHEHLSAARRMHEQGNKEGHDRHARIAHEHLGMAKKAHGSSRDRGEDRSLAELRGEVKELRALVRQLKEQLRKPN